MIRLHGEERLLNTARLTGGRITEPDEVARTVRSVADAEAAAKAEDPITLPPDEQQKLAEAQEKAARELAEQARQELFPVVPGEESIRPEPLLSADEERRLRDGTARENVSWKRPFRKRWRTFGVSASRCANRCCVPSVSGW
ncbi:IncF plasmid conjugative transfer DNA-nicking and unwinding protein TraI (plasmid) [Salmonella bongori N268-08]|uniref:IncF plasmid conjugative transfer DNA-nicking and unwinding protein TraI n=1 Tax=Salmonella bongori N268-08 TaxID=1197719 RepID=S5N4N7_SALBN|nr:IncF plasmid conjugative transfer DNA-nicking and unwinding protein TraI [Salmonella bongori N268-08]